MVLSDTKIGRVSGHGVTRFACVSVLNNTIIVEDKRCTGRDAHHGAI